MALSGTLDTFALPDVMRLLASTEKTGRLRITSREGSGSIWFDSGSVAHSELIGDPRPQSANSDVVFGLLRFTEGSFTFEDDLVADFDGSTEPTDLVLSQAETMLTEWRSIELVVPSTSVWVALCRDLKGPDVMVDADRWRGAAAVGSGTQVIEIALDLDLQEVAVCRLIKELIELGLVEIIEQPAESTTVPVEPDTADLSDQDSFDDHGGDSHDLEEMLEVTSSGDETTDEDSSFGSGEDSPIESFGDDPALDPLLSAGDPLSKFADRANESNGGGLFSAPSASDFDDDEELNPAEMARQLANLSPRAAKAVAEAARATTDAERDAALAAVEAEDETVNRGLLLKFLGSVDS